MKLFGKNKVIRLMAILLCIMSLFVLQIESVFAATSQEVTITGTPSFAGISNSPSTWLLNGITGSGLIDVNTVYYSNPLGDTTAPAGANVVDGECRFTITNTSSIAIDLTVICSDFSGTGDTMTNSNDGSNGAGTYGAYCWYSGMVYADKVVMKSVGSAAMKTNLAASTNIKWGAEIETRTGAWTSTDNMTATMTITATAT